MKNAYLDEICAWDIPIRRLDDVMNPFAKMDVVLWALCGFQSGNYVTMKAGMVYRLLEAARKAGKLKYVKFFVEASSGATGIVLPMLAQDSYFGVPDAKVIIVMNDNVPDGKRLPIHYTGATVIAPQEGLTTIGTARKLGGGGWNNGAWEISEDGGFNLDQYDNPENWRSYRDIVGPQILWKMQSYGGIGLLGCPIGTGGTISGLAESLHEENPATHVAGAMSIPGEVIPGMRSRNQMSEIHSPWETSANWITEVSSLHSHIAVLQIQKYTGMMMGISAGAAYLAMIRALQRQQDLGKLDSLRSARNGKVNAVFVVHDGLRTYTANPMSIPDTYRGGDGKMVWEYLWKS